MVNIIYRHYKKGDDGQIADLFNRAFQMNGVGIVRTSEEWNWRYVKSPYFEPEMIQIAEDVEKNKIVGAIHVNLVEDIIFNSKNYLIGDINDVSCHPDYTRKGIATNLMEMAMKYMNKRNCDLSILAADYKGFARSKIYLKFGYVDVDRELMLINFPNLFKLFKDLKKFASLFPFFFVISYFPRFIYRILLKLSKNFNNISYEIVNNKHFEYMNAANKIIKKFYTGVTPYDKDKFTWARINVPAERLKPTYIIIRKKKEIIGGAVITHRNLHSFKYGLKIRIGIVHEVFLDKSQFKNKRDLHFGYIFLIDKLLKAATRRNIGVLVYNSCSSDVDLIKALKSMAFLKFGSGTIMMKKLNEEIKSLKPKKPLFLPTYISFSTP